MIVKKTLYPKTTRMPISGKPYQVTEKMDGSNICFFVKEDKLYIGQRNYLFSEDEIGGAELGDKLYKGLKGWLDENGENLKASLREGTVICCEWMGMGRLKYGNSLSYRCYMFAKANLDDEMNLKNIYWERDLFQDAFKANEMPDFIAPVPLVGMFNGNFDKEVMDLLYEDYIKDKDRPVEGFVICRDNHIVKYPRYNNKGKLVDYSQTAGKGQA